MQRDWGQRAPEKEGSGVKEDPKTVTPEDKPRQTWKVRPACGGQWLHVISLDELGDCDDGNEYELVSVWLTQKEIDAMPDDFGGW